MTRLPVRWRWEALWLVAVCGAGIAYHVCVMVML